MRRARDVYGSDRHVKRGIPQSTVAVRVVCIPLSSPRRPSELARYLLLDLRAPLAPATCGTGNWFFPHSLLGAGSGARGGRVRAEIETPVRRGSGQGVARDAVARGVLSAPARRVERRLPG